MWVAGMFGAQDFTLSDYSGKVSGENWQNERILKARLYVFLK